MNYQYQEGKNFYLVNNINGQIIEIRRKVIINKTIKYIIDSKLTGVSYVSKNDFYTFPGYCSLTKIK